jgi:small subunit ribosomal protein S3
MSEQERYAVKTVMKRFARNAEVDEFLEQQLADAGYGGCDIQRSPVGTKVTVFVTRPGLVIGRRGVGIRDLTERLEKRFEFPNPQIAVMEVEVPELNPRIMCDRIRHTVMKGTPFRRASLWTLNSIMAAGALGAEIAIAGKLRSERAHHEKYRAGVVPKSGDPAERSVREGVVDVLLKMGLYGIKIKIAVKDAMPPEVQQVAQMPVAVQEVKTEGEIAEAKSE